MKRLLLFLLLLVTISNSFCQSHGVVIPMDSVQFVPDSILQKGFSDPFYFKYGDTVTIEGIVTFNPRLYAQSTNRKATWLQSGDGKTWNAMNVFIEPTEFTPSPSLSSLNADVKFYDNFITGYKVKCTGVVRTYDENTQLNLLPIESQIVDIPSNIDTLYPVPPIDLFIGDFAKNDGSGGQSIERITGEKYEGLFVRFHNVTVVDVTPSGSRFYWSVQDSAGNKIQIRDNSGYYRNDKKQDADLGSYVFTPPSIGTQLEYIQGIIVQSNATTGKVYMLSPRYPNDMKIQFVAPVVKKRWRNPSVPNSSQSVDVYAELYDADNGIKKASLYYSVGLGNKTFQELAMTNLTSTNYWKATIPAQPDGSYVNYWFKVVDNTDLTTNYPDTLASGSLYKVIDGGISSISQIQQTPHKSGNSVWASDTLKGLTLSGIVTARLDQLGVVYIQDNSLPFSGIALKASSSDGLADLKIGDSVLISSAVVVEDYYVTMLTNAGGKNIQVLANNRPLYDPVKTLHPDSINQKILSYSEAYESMLIGFDDIYVVNLNPDYPAGNYGEWVVGYDTVNKKGLRVDDQSAYIEGNFNTDSLSVIQKLDYIWGILYYSFGNYKLLPRDKNDIAGYYTDTTSGITEKHSMAGSLKVFPNPASAQITLVSDRMTENSCVSIYDIFGKLQERVSLDKPAGIANIDLSKLNKGMYFIELINKDGERQGVPVIKE